MNINRMLSFLFLAASLCISNAFGAQKDAHKIVHINTGDYKMTMQETDDSIIAEIATIADEYIGSVHYTKATPLTPGYLHYLSVENTPFRHKGIGEYLFYHVVDYYRENNISLFAWEAAPLDPEDHGKWQALERLVQWYLKLGATLAGPVGPDGARMKYLISQSVGTPALIVSRL